MVHVFHASVLSTVIAFASQIFLGNDPGSSNQIRLSSVQSRVKEVITSEFSSYIEDVLKSKNVAGISLAVVSKDGTTEYGAWGNKTEDGEKLASNTLFNLASCSKAFTAASVGILMEDFASGRNVTPLPSGLKRFDWHTKLKDILPDEWQLMDEWASDKANIRDVLSHVSGLPRHDYAYGPYDSTKDVIRRMKHLRPAFELRERWHYNNIMYMVASNLISTYSQVPYIQFVHDRVFSPLGMSSTTFSPAEAQLSDKLTQSWTGQGRRLPFWFTEDVVELQAGPGGIISNTEDMAKWVSMLLNSGVNIKTNITVVSPSVLKEATTAHNVIEGAGKDANYSISGYGMGWFRASYHGHDMVWHTGSIPGFSTRVALLPNEDFGLITLINTDDKADVAEAVSSRVIDDVLDTEPATIVPTRVMSLKRSRREEIGSGAARSSEVFDPSKYAGTYTNPGYGAFTLCSAASTSSYCTSVLSDFSSVLSPSSLDEFQLFARWPRIWSSHIRIASNSTESTSSTHTFGLIASAIFAHGYGANTGAFETHETGEGELKAIFALADGDVKGFGLFGTVGEETERARNGGGVEETAEAWFAKV